MGEIQGWLRPRFYRSPKDEVTSVLRSVGVCDISHYGKIDVKGKEIDKFLEKNFSTALVARKPGEVRSSGSALEGNKSDPSVIYVCRLAREHALVVTPPFQRTDSVLGIGEAVQELMEGIHLTDLSSILSGFSLTGPSSETLLRKLVEVDVSSRGAHRPFCLEAGLAKVHSTIVRSDRGPSGDGVPSFDLYCGRDYAEYVWDALMASGHEFGIAPFGLEARDRLLGARREGEK
jgi:glycine cleavage system aminomethyltransferase T